MIVFSDIQQSGRGQLVHPQMRFKLHVARAKIGIVSTEWEEPTKERNFIKQSLTEKY